MLDIGSGSVGAAVISFDEKENRPIILYSIRKQITFQDTFTFDRFLSAMIETTTDVLIDVAKKYPQKHRDVMCTLSAPWYVSQTKTAFEEYDKPTAITQKNVDAMVSKEVSQVKKNFNTHYAELTQGTAEIIEVESVNIRLNGYDTPKPFGKQAQTFEAYLYISMTSSQILSAIRELVHKHLHVRDISFRSFALVAFSSLRDMYSHISDFMFLDVSGEMTDISIIRKNTLVETLSFPFGKNYILRTVASELNTVPEDALSSLKLVTEKKATPDVVEKVEKALAHAKEEWLQEFREHMQTLSSHAVLPSTVFLITDPPFDSFFNTVVSTAHFPNLPLMRDELDVQMVSEKVVGKFVRYKPNVPRDSFLVLEALFTQKVRE